MRMLPENVAWQVGSANLQHAEVLFSCAVLLMMTSQAHKRCWRCAGQHGASGAGGAHAAQAQAGAVLQLSLVGCSLLLKCLGLLHAS